MMKLFLSSYRIGNKPQILQKLFSQNKRIAIIGNAADHKAEEERKRKMREETADLLALGLQPTEIDLRDFFGKKKYLGKELNKFGGVWIRGGNVFILRRAMKQSGLDQILINKVNDPYFVYAGYSAAACVIGPTLHGYELVDDPCIIPKGYSNGIIWEGLALVPYSIFPHYKSDHPESALVEKEVQYRIDHNMPYKTIRDGEVIVI